MLALNMLKADAVSYFGSQQKLAEAIHRSQSTIAGWGPIVPLEHAFILERMTAKRARKLKIDPALYPKSNLRRAG